MAYDETLAARIRRVLNGPDVQERKMFGGLAFLVGGRMCCGVQGAELMARVPAEAYGRALGQAHVRPMDFTGKPLKGFIYVSAEGIRTAAALRKWIASGRQVAGQAAAAPLRRAQTRHPRS
jgi:TfoX/Sxy family transcriptional regulator of competence genes